MLVMAWTHPINILLKAFIWCAMCRLRLILDVRGVVIMCLKAPNLDMQFDTGASWREIVRLPFSESMVLSWRMSKITARQ